MEELAAFVFEVRGRHEDTDGETIWVWSRLLVRNEQQSLPGLQHYNAGTLAMRGEDWTRLEEFLREVDSSKVQIKEVIRD